jgi:hypothetical protein
MSWDNQTKSSNSFTTEEMNSGLFFLLQENFDWLLQENGYPILLDQSVSYSNQSKNSSSFNNQTKN